MTRDFAKRGSESPKSSNKTKGSKPRKQASTRATQPPARAGAAGWLWLLTGVALGAFFMFLLYLSDITPDEAPVTPTAKAEKPASELPKPRFDFYQLLEESEVPVSEPPPLSEKDRVKTIYLLQAGSFRHSEDADRMRAELILLNLDVQIESVNRDNGEVWHRVIAGPFENRSRMAKARSVLVSNNIRPLLLKREPES